MHKDFTLPIYPGESWVYGQNEIFDNRRLVLVSVCPSQYNPGVVHRLPESLN